MNLYITNRMICVINRRPEQIPSVGSNITFLYLIILLTGPDAVSCDFENNDLCLWQTNTSVGTWMINKGQTTTANTGPDVDHTKGNAHGTTRNNIVSEITTFSHLCIFHNHVDILSSS